MAHDRGRADEDRGFLARAGDEVRSWFGDEQAGRRQAFDRGEHYDPRQYGGDTRPDPDRSSRGVQNWGQSSDARSRDEGGRGGYGPQHGRGGFQGDYGGGSSQGGFGGRGDWDEHSSSPRGSSAHHDPHYLDWRNRQIADLDRDYHEYRQERQQSFHQDFSTWRQNRSGSRQTNRGQGASTRAAETVRPSDMAGGNAGAPVSPAASGGKYAGEPGPAGIRGENHQDPLRVDENADPNRA